MRNTIFFLLFQGILAPLFVTGQGASAGSGYFLRVTLDGRPVAFPVGASGQMTEQPIQGSNALGVTGLTDLTGQESLMITVTDTRGTSFRREYLYRSSDPEENGTNLVLVTVMYQRMGKTYATAFGTSGDACTFVLTDYSDKFLKGTITG